MVKSIVLFLYIITIIYIMKNLTQYLKENLIKDDFCNLDGDLIVESTFLSRFASWLGGKGGRIVKRFNEYKKDFKDMGKNISNAFNGFLANVNNEDDSIPSDKRQEIVDKVASTNKIDDIIQLTQQLYEENKDDQNFSKSSTMAYLYALGINIAKAKHDTEGEKKLREAFDKIPSDVKKKASDNLKEEVEKNKPEGTQSENNKPSETSEEQPKQEETSSEEHTPDNNGNEVEKKTEEIVDDVVKQDDIQKAAEKASIEIDTLKNKIIYIINDLNADNKEVNIDELDDLSRAIAEIICGAKTIQGNENINNDILSKYKIGDLEEFIKTINNKKE